MTDTCRSVASFGDLDLDYLTSIHELEASDNHMLSFVGECNNGSSLGSSCAAKRGDGLNRTRSEAALPSSGAKKGNPLAALGPDAGLQCVADFLASDSLRCAQLPMRPMPGRDHMVAVTVSLWVNLFLKGCCLWTVCATRRHIYDASSLTHRRIKMGST